MSTSDEPIVELRGHLVQDIYYKIDQFEHSFLQKMTEDTRLFSIIIVKMFMLFSAFVRLLLFFYQYITLAGPALGIKDEVTLKFTKNQINLEIGHFVFWTADGPSKRHRIPWHDTAVYGKRRAMLFFFKRCHLFITHGDSGAKIIDLGPMPEEAFRKLVERLKAFTNSPTVRRQVATTPYRFRAEGLLLLALVMGGILLASGVGLLAVMFGPQLLNLLHMAEDKEEKKPVEEADEEKDQAALERSRDEDLLAEYAFLAQAEAEYRAVLLQDPNNLEAKQGLLLLAEQYVGLAKNAGRSRAWRKAEALLRKAEQIEPTLESIEITWQEIRHAYAELHKNDQTKNVLSRRAAPASPPETVAEKPESKQDWLLDNEDGTVTDLRTGLTGLQQACFDQVTWENALSAAAGLADGQCGLSDDSATGDWRLPNKEELVYLMTWEKSDAVTTIPGRGYWSQTSHEGDNAWAWFADPSSGYVDYAHKINDVHYVWPVRMKAR